MEKFLIDAFFDLSNYSHRGIFEKGTYVWDALAALDTFFQEIELGRIECPIPQGVTLVHPEQISIGKGTIIEPGALIKGPCVIGADCEIRHGAYIRGRVVTGNRCVIGHSTEVKGAILLDDACAAHFNYVGDSILGNRVNLGAGVKLANLRLDKENVSVSYMGKKISTNLQKLGAILGDGAQMGCNSVANPGTLIGKGAFCHPCITASGYLPPHAKVKSTGEIICQ